MNSRCGPSGQKQRNRETGKQGRRTRFGESLVRWFSGSLFLSLACAAVLCVQAPSRLFAQEATKTLTLDQALSIAMEQNRDVQKAIEYQKWVQGKYVEERAAALPHFTLTASGQRVYDDSILGLYGAYATIFPKQQDVTGGEVAMSQALYTWGQVGAAIRAAKLGIASASDQLRQFRQAAWRDVSAAFYDVLLAKEVNAIAAQNLQQKEAHLEEADKRYALGTATDYDVLAARVAVENARPEVIRSANQVSTAVKKLQFLLADSGDAIDVEGTLEAEVAEPPGYGPCLQAALAHRPDLQGMEHRSEVYGQLVKIANAGDKPRLDFRANYGRREYEVDPLTSSGKLWSAGLYISFPFFDGLKTRGQVLQARSDQATAEIEVAKLRDSVALEVRYAVDTAREAGEIVKALAGTADQAERLLAMANKGFEYGVKTKLDVDDAQLAFIQARGNLARARRDYKVALVNLDWVQGVLGEGAPKS